MFRLQERNTYYTDMAKILIKLVLSYRNIIKSFKNSSDIMRFECSTVLSRQGCSYNFRIFKTTKTEVCGGFSFENKSRFSNSFCLSVGVLWGRIQAV